MTVEELDIVVQASIEQALTEFKKIVPQLKRTIKQVEDNLNDIDTKGMTNKVQQAVQQVKQKINEVKNTGVDKQLQTQFNRAGASVQKYQGQLDQAKEKLRQVYAEMDNIQANTWKAYTPEGVEIGNKAIEPAVNNDLAGNKQYQNLSKEAAKLEGQIASLNSKLNTTKQEYTQIEGQIQQTTTKQSTWNNIVNKVKTAIAGIKKNTNSTGSAFQSVATISEKVRNGCSQIFKITGRIVTKIKQMGTGFKQGLGHILKYAGALFSLQSIYSTLSGAANSWLSSQNSAAQQLNANIEYMKYSMGSALAPVIEFITNLVFQLMKAIQSLVYAFSGINIFANASAKAYSSMASSAKEANKETKQLAGVHSEINNIQSNDNSSSGSGGGSVKPSFDLSQIDSQMSPLAQKLYDFFKPLVDSWNTYGAGLVEQVKTTASQIGELLSSVWGCFEEIITNGTAYSILENILAIIGNIAQAWANAWNYNNNGDVIFQNLANAFNNLLVAINNVVSSPEFQEWLNNCSDKFREISEKIASIDWQPLVNALFEIGSTIGTLALDILSGLVDIFKWLAENPAIAEVLLAIAVAIGVVSTAVSIVSSVMAVLNPILQATNITLMPLIGIIIAIIAVIAIIVVAIMNWDTVTQAIANTWEWIKQKAIEIWNAIAEFFTNLWNSICEIATNVWNGIKDFFVNIWTGISTFFSNIWNGIKNVAMTVWNAITTTISNVINGIKNTISNVLNTIKTVWSNIWNGIKNVVTSVWNGIWNIIKSVVNNILSGIEGFVNGVIRGINWVLSGISKVANAVGSLIGLNPISLQLSTISLPRLAKGAVLKVPTVAEMAEYPGASTNPEIVTPQNIMEETFDRVLARYQDNDNSQSIYLTVNVGNAKLGQILLDDLRNMKRRSGKGIEALVGG
jgi:phage-related protein